MALSYESIMESKIFKFVVGPRKKEYSVHGAALSGLSKPLDVLLNGPHKEAQELRVEWLDVDEKTFVRFTQWAYTKDYVTEEPEIILDQPNININSSSNLIVADQPLYSLLTIFTEATREGVDHCRNVRCNFHGIDNSDAKTEITVICIVCQQAYNASVCERCFSVYTDCPHCEKLSTTERTTCFSPSCRLYKATDSPRTRKVSCPKCQESFRTKTCSNCTSTYSDCPGCRSASTPTKRVDLISKFLDKAGLVCVTPSTVHTPRKNTEGCEDYSNVFLCHAKLYVLGEIYDIPQLRQLSLHRLHATLKEFTLYPSRLNDISTLAKYVFDNTPPGNKIWDMITLYYACIIEDASKHEGLKSLIEEVPDFAYGLISRMSERLD